MTESDEKKLKIEIAPTEDVTDEGCRTFILRDEGHTLGNSLRYVIMKNPDVEFCGYTITHPLEKKINFRIQTKAHVTALSVLKKGLADLSDLCTHVYGDFEKSVADFRRNQKNVVKMDTS